MYCVHCPWAVETACAPARLATKQRGGEFSVVNMRVCVWCGKCVCVLTERGYLLHHSNIRKRHEGEEVMA